MGVSFIYASCFTLIKAGLAYSPPLAFGGLRALIGGLILLGFLLIQKQPFLPKRDEWGAIIIIGFISTFLNFGAMFLSPGRTGAGIASVLGNIQPLITLVLAAIFLDERFTRPKMLALIFGLFGVSLIAYPALSGPSRYGIGGELLALSASASSAVGSILVKQITRKASMLIVAAWQLVLGSLPLLVLSFRMEPAQQITWTPDFIGDLLFLAIVGTSLVTMGWYWLLQNHEVGHLTLYLFLTPLFGLLIAVIVFNEKVGLLESMGVFLTLAGIGVIALKAVLPGKRHQQI